MPRTRRDFLKASLGAATLATLGPQASPRQSGAAWAAPPRRGSGDTVLVVVQLAGGNDGLNTVVPYGDQLYAKNRPTLRLPASQLHKIDSLLGFHPRMGAFMRLLKKGCLSVVQGVGYPKPSGGHAESMRNWQTGRPHDSGCQTGWVGRTMDELDRPGEPAVPGVFVGRIAQPLTLNAQKTIAPSIQSIDQYTLRAMPGPGGGRVHHDLLAQTAEMARTDEGNSLQTFVQQAAAAAYGGSRRIEAAARSSPRASTYPPLQFASMLRTIAQLIRADLGVRVYCTELGGNEPGGFDNHANQLGNHCALLQQLSESVDAFVHDLERDHLLDRVLLMTFSEFGRTVKENGRRGTGHGSAAPLFLVGGKLKGGLVGQHPNLSELENNGQKFHTDFRRVYATVLDRWLGCDSRTVLGGEFEPLDLLQS